MSSSKILNFTGEYYRIENFDLTIYYKTPGKKNLVPYKEVIIGKFDDDNYYIGYQTEKREGEDQWYIFTNVMVDMEHGLYNPKRRIYRSWADEKCRKSYRKALKMYNLKRIVEHNGDKVSVKYIPQHIMKRLGDTSYRFPIIHGTNIPHLEF